jgi:hypothetical protein
VGERVVGEDYATGPSLYMNLLLSAALLFLLLAEWLEKKDSVKIIQRFGSLASCLSNESCMCKSLVYSRSTIDAFYAT